jgi:hypothetical protein
VSRPRFITIDGKRYLWRDLVRLYRSQAKPAAPQPTLFVLHDDRRPPSERCAAGRYRNPDDHHRLTASASGVLESDSLIPNRLGIPNSADF